uniref:Uncharacterized protein n=1 Tax=viral metagenome TaxID=1070528 RepID=A0A6C0EGF3_9ZZZZ
MLHAKSRPFFFLYFFLFFFECKKKMLHAKSRPFFKSLRKVVKKEEQRCLYKF